MIVVAPGMVCQGPLFSRYWPLRVVSMRVVTVPLVGQVWVTVPVG